MAKSDTPDFLRDVVGMFESAKGREKRDIRSVAKFIELALVLDKDMVSTLELVISAAFLLRLASYSFYPLLKPFFSSTSGQIPREGTSFTTPFRWSTSPIW